MLCVRKMTKQLIYTNRQLTQLNEINRERTENATIKARKVLRRFRTHLLYPYQVLRIDRSPSFTMASTCTSINTKLFFYMLSIETQAKLITYNYLHVMT